MNKNAELWRMKTDKHICPYGLKAKDLLERKGFDVEDHFLRNKEETDSFKEKHNVKTTPQAFIDGKRIGGYDDLRSHFGMKPQDEIGSKYDPIIAILVTSLLMGTAITWNALGTLQAEKLVLSFVAVAMVILAIQKLRDLNAFSMQFITYDLLAMK